MTRGSEPGYRRERNLYKLVFDQYPGLVVRTRSASAGMVFDVSRLTDLEPTPDTVEEMFEKFAGVLVSWNLENDEGEPIPATVESLMDEDFDFVMQLIHAWIRAVTGVSAPLEKPSTSGNPSLVESLPMDVLSGNRAS